MSTRFATVLVGVWAASAAPAAVVSTLAQDGADLVWSYSGSVDFSATGTGFSTAPVTLLDAGQGLLVNFLDTSARRQAAATLTKNGTPHGGGFGSVTNNFLGTALSGSVGFSLQFPTSAGAAIFVDDAIADGQSFSGAARFSNLSLADLGITSADVGTYQMTWATSTGTDSASVTIAPIPLPAGLPLALAGLAGLAMLRRR